MSPEQEQMYNLIQFLNRPSARPAPQKLSYQDWLKQRNGGQQTIMTPQQQQSQPVNMALDLAKSDIGKSAASAVGGYLGAQGITAAMPTVMPSVVGPSMMMPAMTPMLPGAATGVAGSGAAAGGSAAAGAGTGMLGTAASGAAAVAAPIILGTMIDKHFFKSKPARKFNVDELVENDVDNRTRIGAKFKDYENLSPEIKKNLLQTLADNKTLVMPGYATKEGETVRRVGEDVNWGSLPRLLKDSYRGKGFQKSNASVWGDGVNATWVPEEDDVAMLQKAGKIKDEDASRYINSIRAIRGANEGSPTIPQITPQPRVGSGAGQEMVFQDGQTAPPPIMIPRSKTRSPGIDLNGNRIKY